MTDNETAAAEPVEDKLVDEVVDVPTPQEPLCWAKAGC